MTFKIKIPKFQNQSFTTKVSPNIKKETESDTITWKIFKSDVRTSFFIGCKLLKYSNNFYNWHLLILLQKWAQTNKVK